MPVISLLLTAETQSSPFYILYLDVFWLIRLQGDVQDVFQGTPVVLGPVHMETCLAVCVNILYHIAILTEHVWYFESLKPMFFCFFYQVPEWLTLNTIPVLFHLYTGNLYIL